MRRNQAFVLLAGVALVAALAATPALGGSRTSVIYDSTAKNGPPANLPSVGAEAYAFNELGNLIDFAAGGPRRLGNVTVTLSSWGCVQGHWYSGDCSTRGGATFDLPMTLTIYAVGPGDTLGPVLATSTETFSVSYRPSASPKCTGGRWYSPGLKTCFNGLAQDFTFGFGGQNVTLPDRVVFGFAYNTTHYGYSPIGESAPCYTSSGGCGYDSLNIALNTEPPSAGSSADGTLWQNSPFGGEYCDGGVGGTGTFREDAGCWSPYVPAVQFKASGGPTG